MGNTRNAPAATERSNRPNSSWPRVMWKLFRPHSLTASFIPVLIGSALAWRGTGQVHALLLAAMLAACTLIQAATNMFNEYFDFVSGLDTAESVGIAGVITQNDVEPKSILRAAVASLLLATLLGIYICSSSSWWLAAIGAVSMLAGYLYTGGPWPIAATPFGEVFAGGFMGCGIVLLSCFIQQRFVTVNDLLVSVPSAILIGAILTANNIRDREGDKNHGRRTLAILLGHERSVYFLACCLIGANVWVVALVIAGILPLRALLALGSLWPSVSAIRIFRAGATPAQMMPGMSRVAQTNTVFGILLLIGIL